MTSSTESSRLFIAMFPTGIGYADRSREEHGDYKRVAFLSYRTLQFEPEKGANRELIEQARQHAVTIQAMRGQEFRVSTCGQTVLLGSQLP